MDRNYIDNHHVVARYLADRLSDEDRRAFETYLHAHPEIVEDLEAAARLKVGLRTLSQRRELSSLLESPQWFRGSRYLAMAASLAIIAIGALIWFGQGTFATATLVASLESLKDGGGKLLPLASTHAILRTRGTSYDAEIELPKSAQAIKLRVLPEYEAHPPRFRFALSRIADDESLTLVATLKNTEAGSDGFVDVYFDSSRLQPGRYRLSIGGETETDAAESVSFFKLKLSAATSEAR